MDLIPKKLTLTIDVNPEGEGYIDPDFVEDYSGIPLTLTGTDNGYEVWKGELTDPAKIKEAMDALSNDFDWDMPYTTEGDGDVYWRQWGDEDEEVRLSY